MIPGSNLLNAALSIIAKQELTYYRWLSRTVNDVGQWVPSYAPGATMKGSFQPVPKNLYESYGLDFARQYFTFYTSNPVQDLARNGSPDIFIFKGDRFQAETNNDWYKVDGWRGVLCVLLEAGSLTPPFGFDDTPVESGNRNFENGGFGNAGQ